MDQNQNGIEDLEEITPDGSFVPVYLDTTPCSPMVTPDLIPTPTVIISPDGSQWVLVDGNWVPA